MSPGARLAAVFVGGPVGVIVSGALVGVGVTTVGLVAGAVTLRFAKGWLRGVARVWVRDKTPTRGDSLFAGWCLLGIAAMELPLGFLTKAAWSGGTAPAELMAICFVSLYVGFVSVILALGALRASDMLGRVPALLERGEEAAAVAVQANGFGRTRALAMLVGTEARLLWVKGREVREIAYADVERFEIDGVRGELRLHLADDELFISPVPRREMKALGKLLSRAKAR